VALDINTFLGHSRNSFSKYAEKSEFRALRACSTSRGRGTVSSMSRKVLNTEVLVNISPMQSIIDIRTGP
jgi:hypothetical protein